MTHSCLVSSLHVRARLDFAVKFAAQENFLRGTSFPRLKHGPACIVEQSLWFLALMGRLVVLGSLVWTAVVSEYCLVVLAKGTLGLGLAWWVFAAVAAGLLLLLSVPLVLQALAERPIRKFANRKGLSWLTMYLDATNHAGRKCAKIFFGTGPLDDEPDEGDPRVQMIENSMLQIATSTKNAIVESMEAVERRVKAHASAIGESICMCMMNDDGGKGMEIF